ncbi:hypothetical protein BEN42_06175 [Leptospira interrogans serovar Canicola]|nr:hypothetical protein [Leptospira interrogans serovar Canicola]
MNCISIFFTLKSFFENVRIVFKLATTIFLKNTLLKDVIFQKNGNILRKLIVFYSSIKKNPSSSE